MRDCMYIIIRLCNSKWPRLIIRACLITSDYVISNRGMYMGSITTDPNYWKFHERLYVHLLLFNDVSTYTKYKRRHLLIPDYELSSTAWWFIQSRLSCRRDYNVKLLELPAAEHYSRHTILFHLAQHCIIVSLSTSHWHHIRYVPHFESKSNSYNHPCTLFHYIRYSMTFIGGT